MGLNWWWRRSFNPLRLRRAGATYVGRATIAASMFQSPPAPESRSNAFHDLAIGRLTSFNPLRLRRAGATPAPARAIANALSFNPLRLRRAGATLKTSAVNPLEMFQSPPAPESRSNVKNDVKYTHTDVSIPSGSGEPEQQLKAINAVATFEVSIPSGSGEPEQHRPRSGHAPWNCFNPLRLRRAGATREGQIDVHRVRFQSPPAPESRSNGKDRTNCLRPKVSIPSGSGEPEQRRPRRNKVPDSRFNPLRLRRAGATHLKPLIKRRLNVSIPSGSGEPEQREKRGRMEERRSFNPLRLRRAGATYSVAIPSGAPEFQSPPAPESRSNILEPDGRAARFVSIPSGSGEPEQRLGHGSRRSRPGFNPLRLRRAGATPLRGRSPGTERVSIPSGSGEPEQRSNADAIPGRFRFNPLRLRRAGATASLSTISGLYPSQTAPGQAIAKRLRACLTMRAPCSGQNHSRFALTPRANHGS